MNKRQLETITVIDGLARSGTTLLTSILDAQMNLCALRGLFYEPFWSLPDTRWKSGFIEKKVGEFPEGGGNTERFFAATLGNIKKLGYENRIPINIEELYINQQLTYCRLDDIYKLILRKAKCEHLFLRWNQAIGYIDKWVCRKNHRWVAVIRNPLARAISDKRAFGESIECALSYSRFYAENLELAQRQYAEDTLLIIYYEDLCSTPLEVINRIINLTGGSPLSDLVIDLKRPDGSAYRNETSWVPSPSNGGHRHGTEFTGIRMRTLAECGLESLDLKLDEWTALCKEHPVYFRYLDELKTLG